MNFLKLLTAIFLSIFFASSVSAHSTSGYFVTNGTDCYFVMPNWHNSIGDQNNSLSNNDGVYLDFNLDGLYDSTIDPAVGPFPRGVAGGEYFPFSDFLDISDLFYSPAAFTTWEGEIETWFAANVGAGYSASLVWDPSTDTGCSQSSYYALVAPIGTCPTVAGTYFATVADGTVTSEPCGAAPGASTDGTFDLDLSGVIVAPSDPAIPTMGEWGLISLGLIFLILGVTSVKQRSEAFEFQSK